MTSNTHMSHRNVVDRVTSVRITNFRGFGNGKGGPGPGSDAHIPTDADVVLLVGPNGYGKTSLLEGLSLLLNRADRPATDSFDGRFFHNGSDNLSVEATVRLKESAADGEPSTEDTSSFRAIRQRGGEVERKLRDPRAPDDVDMRVPTPGLSAPDLFDRAGQLKARLSTFYQDDVDALFDETTQGATLRQVFEPPPPRLESLRHRITELRESLGEEMSALRTSPPRAADTQAELSAAMAELGQLYRELVKGGKGWPVFPQSEPDDMNSPIERFAREVNSLSTGVSHDRAPRPDELRDDLIKLWRREEDNARQRGRRRHADRQKIERRKARRRQLEEELRRIDEAYPTLDEDLGAFQAEEGPDGTGLLEILRSLERNCTRWEESASGDPALDILGHELSRVRPADVGKCARELEGWLRPRRQAMELREQARREIDQIDEEIRKAEASGRAARLSQRRQEFIDACGRFERAWEEEQRRLRDVAEWEERHRQAQELEERNADLAWLEEELNTALGPDKQLMTQVGAVVNSVLRRLASEEENGSDEGAGIVNVGIGSGKDSSGHEREYYHLVRSDGRDLSCLSTGQKSQLATAFMVGQNRIAGPCLNHRVLSLDDVSTSYDLASLTRETILWRQLAYCETGEGRRQIFLSSHHDDMTSHLLNLLVPVEGRSLLVLRFNGWSLGAGPAIEAWEVEPQPAFDQGTGERDRLARRMKEQLWTTYT